MTLVRSGATCSVVIPAHNEQAVIGRCLGTLLAAAQPGEFEVLVAANGCQDRTAEVAHQSGHPDVSVIEIDAAGKSAALNQADQVAQAYPRLYLDADVELTTAGARAMALALHSAPAAVASPVLDLTGCTRAARSYWLAWQARNREPHSGTGCYGLSAAGRSRFAEFPPVLADDQFVAELLNPVVVAAAPTIVRPPRTLAAIAQRRIRIERGNRQVERLAGQGRPGGQPDAGPSAGGRLERSAGVLLLVPLHVGARAWAWLSPAGGWHQDRSSRAGSDGRAQ